jgi:hypothetical protein
MKNKTIAQQLGVKEFPFEIKDKNGNLIYYENSDSDWWKREFDDKGNIIYYENSNGFWWKNQYDDNGNQIYYKNSTDNFWWKREFDDKGNITYYENSSGEIIDNRPKIKEVTMDEVAKAFGVDVKNLMIKK